jgi:hypothetical protein
MAVKKKPVNRFKTKPAGKTRQLGLKNKPPKAVLDLDAIKRKYMLMWADPTEIRSDEAIAKALGVDSSQLAAWQFDPTFYVPASELFQRNLPVLRAQVIRKLSQQALDSKSSRGMRTLAEIVGLVKGKGDVNLFAMMGSHADSGNARLRDMTDEDLEAELERMATLAYPSDLLLKDGKVLPGREVIDVEYEDVGPDQPGSRPDDQPSTERVPLLTADGEDQEAVG